MSPKANLVLLFVTGLLLAALIGQNGSLALMTLPFLFYLLAGLLAAPKDVRLRADRARSKIRCETDESIPQQITIVNEGAAVPRLAIRDRVPPQAHLLSGACERQVALAANATIDLGYSIALPRGRYEWRGVEIVASDPFGLFEQRCDLPAPVKTLVLPRTLPLRRLPVRLAHTLHTPGPNLSRLPGSGIDFWGVREYHPGDSLRWIHWRAAARHPQQFFTKQFEREEMADVGLLLDARGITSRTSDGDRDDLLEHAVQATASLAKSLLQMGNRVSMLIMGERFVRVFPGTGKHQLVRILDRLAECRPGDRVMVDALKHLPVRLFPSHALVVLVSPLRPDDFAPVARLRASGYQVMLVSPNPISFLTLNRPTDPGEVLAVRAARLERAALLWRIRRLGVAVVDWPVDQPLAQYVGSVARIIPGGRQ